MEHDGWSLRTPEEDCPHLEQQVTRLLDEIEPYHRDFEELIKEFRLDVEIGCSVFLGNSKPTMHFGLNLLSRISRYQSEIDIDLYLNVIDEN